MFKTLTINRLLVCWAVVLIALLPIVFFFALNSTASAEEPISEKRYSTFDCDFFSYTMTGSVMSGYKGEPSVGSSIYSLISPSSTSVYSLTPLPTDWRDYFINDCIPIVNIGTSSYKTITFCFDLLGDMASVFDIFQGVYSNLGYVNFYYLNNSTPFGFCLLGVDKKAVGSGYKRYFVGFRISNTLVSISPLESFTGYEGEWVAVNVRFPSDMVLDHITGRLPCSYRAGVTGSLTGVGHTYTNSLVDMAMITERFDMVDNMFDGFENSYVDLYYNKGYDTGFSTGNSSGYKSGYNEGYNEGVLIGQGDVSASISGFFPSIFGGIGSFFKELLSFEVFGVSALTFVGTIGAVMLILFFVHFIRG